MCSSCKDSLEYLLYIEICKGFYQFQITFWQQGQKVQAPWKQNPIEWSKYKSKNNKTSLKEILKGSV